MKFILLVLLTSCGSNLQVGVNNGKQICATDCPTIDSFVPVAALSGERVTITGSNLNKLTNITIGDQNADLTVSSSSEGSFIMPEGGPGELLVSSPLVQASTNLTNSATIYRLASDYPWFSGAASEVCNTDKFYDRFGKLNDGTKDCSTSQLKLDPSIILEGHEINGIRGTLSYCISGGQANCVTAGDYRSANIIDLKDKIVNSKTVAGVVGTGLSHSLCSSDGQKSCVTHDGFLAASIGSLNASNIKTGVNIGGVTGTFGGIGGINCSTDGQIGCTTIAAYPAIDTGAAGLAAKIRTGQVIAGVSGTYSPDFPDVANVLSSDTVNSVSGTLTLPAAASVRSSEGSFGVGGNGSTASLSDCNAANQSACVATATYATMDLSSAGATTDLTSANFDTTIRTGANFEFWDSAGARYVVAGDTDLAASNIKNSVEVHGITGSVVESPANCSGNGQQGCVTTASYESAVPRGTWDLTASFPGAGYYTGISNAPTASDLKRTVQVAGVTGNFPSATSPLPRYSSSSGASTATSGSDETDLTLFATQLTSAGNFEYWSSDGMRYTGSGDADINAGNIVSGVQFENLSITGTGVASTPTGFQATVSGPTQIELSWSDVGVSGYLLVFREGAAVTWTPTDGNAYSTGAQGADTVIYVGNSTSFSHTSLTAGNTYHYAIYAYNGSNNYSSAATLSQAAQTTCASLGSGTWILVPGDSDYGTRDFCVMKYEAKNVSNAPESNASGTPWASISQTEARNECQSLGVGYDLISNEQWMTIGAHVANIGTNWSSSSVGTGNMFKGHTDASPNSACAASTDDSLAYIESDCTPKGSGGGEDDEGTQRRTLSLSNGEIIWDFSGNIWEWVTYYDPNGRSSPLAAWQEFPTISDGTNLLVRELVPTNAIKSFWNDSWNSTQEIGGYYSGTNGATGAMHRGGGVVFGGGVFQSAMNVEPSHSAAHIGFRCVSLVP